MAKILKVLFIGFCIVTLFSAVDGWAQEQIFTKTVPTMQKLTADEIEAEMYRVIVVYSLFKGQDDEIEKISLRLSKNFRRIKKEMKQNNCTDNFSSTCWTLNKEAFLLKKESTEFIKKYRHEIKERANQELKNKNSEKPKRGEGGLSI